jgi:anaphase-promoting complex subunit 5
VLECEDCELAARTYSTLVDAYVGLAGGEVVRSVRWLEGLKRALEYLDCAGEEWRKIEDLRGQLEMLVKKATVLRLCGDDVLANNVASRYLDLKREYAEVRV